MRTIAIVGAGYAGLLAAHALIRENYRVTLFSDKSPEDFLLRSRPTGITARFNHSLEFERKLGLNHWEKEVAWFDYAHITLAHESNNRLLTSCSRTKDPVCAIDLRMQSARWLTDLQNHPLAEVHIESVTMERLEEIAGDHDLTILAAGRGAIRTLFKRDESRSVYTSPQRKLVALGIVGPPMGFEGAPGLPIKFSIFPRYGEFFWLPWLHKDKGKAWGITLEIKEGGKMDRFDGIQSGDLLLEELKKLVREMVPWDYNWIKNAELADENAWIMGSFTPEVRKVVGTLPSGKKVMALGDTAISFDPIAAQGANTGNRMVRNLLKSILEREDRPFDGNWMQTTFDNFWQKNHWTFDFMRVLLDPMTAAGKELLIAAYGSTGRHDDESIYQKAADIFAQNFEEPSKYTSTLTDIRKIHADIRERTGQHWLPTAVKNRLKIAKGQLLQKMGKDPGHPSTVPYN